MTNPDPLGDQGEESALAADQARLNAVPQLLRQAPDPASGAARGQTPGRHGMPRTPAATKYASGWPVMRPYFRLWASHSLHPLSPSSTPQR